MNPLTKEYQQQLPRWREMLQRSERGEGVDEVIEIMEQIEPTVNACSVCEFGRSL